MKDEGRRKYEGERMDQGEVLLILASRSPRRRELLAEAGYRFVVCPPGEDVEEDVASDADPERLVRELAHRKAASVVRHMETHDREAVHSSRIVLGCDTVVECDGHILGKPADRTDARRMLQTLRGRRHRVLSGLCLWPLGAGEPRIEVASTILHMDPLDDRQLEQYLAGNEWQGKAGAFGYQDRTGWVHVVEGSESNVVGLPMELLAEMLRRRG